MFSLLSKAFSLLKQDFFMIMPFMLMYLAFSIFEPYFVKGDEMNLTVLGFSYLQAIVKVLVMGLTVLMAVHASKLKAGFSDVLSLFFEKLYSLISLGILLNLPVIIGMYLLFLSPVSVATNEEATSAALPGLALLLVVMILAVPYTAMWCFSIVHTVKTKTSITESTMALLAFFLKNYRIAIRWFLVVLLVDSILLLMLPIKFSNLYISDILFSLIQACLDTVVAFFTFYVYKEYSVGKELTQRVS